MAIYHVNLSSGSRGGGQSAAAKLDYIEREGKYSKGKQEVAHIEHGNMPEFARHNAKYYWQAADAHERENGRLFQQFEFALPRELTAEQQIALAREFVAAVCNKHQLPYSFAIHKGEYDHRGKRVNGEAKPHVHLVFSERQNDGIARDAEQWFKRANSKNPSQGGAAKVREIKATEWLEQQRQTWEQLANAALEKAGHDARIDHRTLAAQGINDRLAQPKKGKAAYMAKRGISSERITRFDEAMKNSEKLESLQKSALSLNEKIVQLKAEILRLAKQHFTPEHTDKTRSLDTLKTINQSATMGNIRTLNHSATLNHLRKETTHEQQQHTRDDLQTLPQQRDDNRDHHKRKQANGEHEHLLHRDARHDMAGRRTAPHQAMQPLRATTRETNSGISQQERYQIQQAAALVAQFSYALLEVHTTGKLKSLEEAQMLRKYLEHQQAQNIQTITELKRQQQEDKQQYETLQSQNFFKRWQAKAEIDGLEKAIKARQKTIKQQTQNAQDLPQKLEQAQEYEYQCTQTLAIYALALRNAGLHERLKQLPSHLQAHWTRITSQTYEQHKRDSDILRAERYLKGQFITLQQRNNKQHTQEKHR